MNTPIHILYLPGFGDGYDKFRLKALQKWRFASVSVELVPMKWDTGTFQQKVARVDQAIDRAKKGDNRTRVVIVGESAGGSMAVHTYARRGDELYKVMTLCGKNSHPEKVGEYYYRRSPAFKESMELLNHSIGELTDEQKSRFVSIHPLADPVVPVRDTLLDGCKQVRLLSAGHLITIALGLTIFAPLIVRAAKR